MLWMNKPSHRGHAIIFNVNINWAGEVMAYSWWYPPRVYDAVVQEDMDADIPWVFDGPRPDLRLGDPHYSTARNFLTPVVSSDAGVPVTELPASYNRYINHERNLVERVFADVKKYPWFQSHAAGGRQYDYDFITKMFIFSCHVHNLRVRWRGR